MKEKEIYELWRKNAVKDADLIEDLEKIENDENEIYDRFYKDLSFGTAGLRGIIGAGSNRMNIYTVRKATKGLADYLNLNYKSPSVAISFDSRIKSDLFAKEAAKVLATNGIKVYIVKELCPVPFLSFAVRSLSASAGIMITASHNPSNYNGYKCYGPDGCQMTEKSANKVYELIEKVDMFNVKTADFNEAVSEGKIVFIEDDLKGKYLDAVEAQSINKNICKNSGLRVVYTPLNGAGNKFVREIFSRIGVDDVHVVKEQENPDGNFPTCKYPNPEAREALSLAVTLAEKVDADLVVATDPDSDRLGIAVKDENEYAFLSGNEVGIMLFEYILSQRKLNGTLPQRPFAVKTIVSTDLTDKIAERYNCELKEVLTGFKYIGEQILGLEKKGQEDRFVFGYEESYGYLSGTYVRDKDGVVASMLICELAAYLKKQNKTLVDFVNDLYEKYGFYENTVLNFVFKGAQGSAKMTKIMDNLREKPFNEIAGYKVVKIADYSVLKKLDIATGRETDIDLPKSNVLSFYLENNNKLMIRPSGTEPKIKAYITAVGKSFSESKKITKEITNFISKIIND